MGPGRLGTWNKVAPPTRSANMIAEEKPAGWAGAAYVPSKETPQRAEQAGGMKSDKFSGRIGNGNVKKTSLKSPSAEPMPRGLMDGGKY